MRLRYDPRAIQDLSDIRSYLVAHAAEKAAEKIRRHLQTRANRLRTRPFMGIASEHPNIRILPPTQYPYRIYYAIRDEEVVILHIRHTARRPPGDLL
jgi:toxin ParE1/3/4